MAFPKSKRKNLVVDDLKYTSCVNEAGYTEDGAVKLNVAVRAEYGTKSLCIIEGMANREYWSDYPNYDPSRTFSITPRVICEIIRHALQNGWDPNERKSDIRIQLNNEGLRKLIDQTL